MSIISLDWHQYQCVMYQGVSGSQRSNGSCAWKAETNACHTKLIWLACRSAPLSLTLFGEDSATSFDDEPPAAMQLGPVWNPAWLGPSPPSSSPPMQHAQHAQQAQDVQQHAQDAQQAQHAQQESQHSLPAAIPRLASLQPATEDDSDFGSFTGTAAQPAQWLPSSKVQSAQDYFTQAEQQAPAHFQTVASSASSLSGSSTLANRPTMRPAAAAATASVLQSMDRSAPISLGLFGEQSYDDPVLEMPEQAIDGAAVDLQQKAVPSSPGQMASASAQQEGGIFEEGYSPGQPQPDFKPQHNFPPQFEFKPQHEIKPPWQHQHDAQLPMHSPSAVMHDTASDDFSPSWQQAGGAEGLNTTWQNPTSSDRAPPAAEWVPSAQSSHSFAKTWPSPVPDADPLSSQQLPGRQALSGPISLELFGLEEQQDQPLGVPPQPQANTLSAPPLPHPVLTEDHQHLGDGGMYAQQPPPAGQAESSGSGEQFSLARQISPGPISLELFGLEETEDAPLDMPIQASITVIPEKGNTAVGMSLPTGGLSKQCCHGALVLLQPLAARQTLNCSVPLSAVLHARTETTW